MAQKQNRPPGGRGGAVLEVDHAGAAINFNPTPKADKKQDGQQLAAYRLDANLVMIEARYV